MEYIAAMEESNALAGLGVEEEKAGETTEPQVSMESLLEKEGLGIDFPRSGETRTGIIASISETEILVSVGAKSEGVISGREFDQMDAETREGLQLGQEIPVYVLSPEDKNGNLVLSYNRAREEMDWEFAEKLAESGDPLDSEIVGFNKGGLIVSVGRLRGFVPASQVSLSRRASITGDTPDKRYGKMVSEPITVNVIEVDRTRRRLILSERTALQETRETLKERLLEDLQIGDVRLGRVTSLAEFGAFVNIDGADGLVHMSEISWERIEHPNEVLKIGQEVKVEVISIDHERKRIGLSIRRLEENPWVKKVEHIHEGQLIEGTITHLTKFGAFARLGEDDLEGLIHVSELSASRVEHPKEVVKEGDSLTLRVIKIDKDRQRIGLSLRKVDSAAYADLDWKMLRDEIDAAIEGEDEHEEVSEVEEPESALEEAEVAEEEPEQEIEAVAEEVSEVEQPEAALEEVEVAEEEPEQEIEAMAEEVPEEEGIQEEPDPEEETEEA
jgi:small subunit ribosomal protein S1